MMWSPHPIKPDPKTLQLKCPSLPPRGSNPIPKRSLLSTDHLPSTMAVRAQSHALHGFKLSSQCPKIYSPAFRLGANRVCQNVLPKISCSMNMTAGEPDRINLEVIRDKARKVWESCPEPVKTFPWTRAFENFIQLIADLTLTVITYLSVPLLAVSSLSEMSYCAHERRLFLVPFPLLVGAAVAGAFREAALEASPLLKDAEVPWHLIAAAVFFTLLKLPGPYYPYWGRIFIPHFANGGLWRTLYFAFLWFRRPKKTPGTPAAAHTN